MNSNDLLPNTESNQHDTANSSKTETSDSTESLKTSLHYLSSLDLQNKGNNRFCSEHWIHFTRVDRGKDRYAQCKHCPSEIKITNGVRGLKSHRFSCKGLQNLIAGYESENKKEIRHIPTYTRVISSETNKNVTDAWNNNFDIMKIGSVNYGQCKYCPSLIKITSNLSGLKSHEATCTGCNITKALASKMSDRYQIIDDANPVKKQRRLTSTYWSNFILIEDDENRYAQCKFCPSRIKVTKGVHGLKIHSNSCEGFSQGKIPRVPVDQSYQSFDYESNSY